LYITAVGLHAQRDEHFSKEHNIYKIIENYFAKCLSSIIFVSRFYFFIKPIIMQANIFTSRLLDFSTSRLLYLVLILLPFSHLAAQISGSQCLQYTDPTQIQQLPLVGLKCRFFFIQNGSGTQYHAGNGPTNFYVASVAYKVIALANQVLAAPAPLNLSNGQASVPDTRIRFQLGDQSSSDPISFCFINEPINIVPGFLNIVLDDIGNGDAEVIGGSIYVHGIRAALDNTGSIPTIKGRAINHEFGHLAGLCHSFSPTNTCSDLDWQLECGQPDPNVQFCPGTNTPCSEVSHAGNNGCGFISCRPCLCGELGFISNNLMGYNGIEEAITPCQWSSMYQLASQAPYGEIYDQTPCSLAGQPDIIIPVNTTVEWQGLNYVHGNVIVKQKALLIIRCETYFAEGKGITVEKSGRLFVEGSRVASIKSDCTWNGIAVEGNTTNQPTFLSATDPLHVPTATDAGVVYCNGATIERALTGIKSNKGGLVIAMNYTRFIFNGSAADFQQFNVKNTSFFRDCVFDSNTRGVKGTSVFGIEFDGNVWSSQNEYDLLGTNATFKVFNLNRFENIKNYGIKLDYTFPMAVPNSKVEILDNYFFPSLVSSSSKGIAINSSPNSVYPMVISDNRFYQSGSKQLRQSIDIRGTSKFSIRNNIIYSQLYCMGFASTGSLPSDVNCNYLQTGIYGMLVRANNRGMVFLNNDFASPVGGDVTIGVLNGIAGEVFSSQGNIQIAASNCFENQTNAIQVPTNQTIPFQHWVPEEMAQGFADCYVPTKNLTDTPPPSPTNNYWIPNAESLLDDCEPVLALSSERDITKIRQQTSLLLTQLSANPSDFDTRLLFARSQRWQHMLLDSLLILQGNNLGEITNLLQSEETDRGKRDLVGHLLGLGLVSMFDSVLDMKFDSQKQEDAWFLNIAEINKRLYGDNPEPLSNTELDQLSEIANSGSELAGYACALMYALNQIDCDEVEEFVLQTNRSAAQLSAYLVYPSPTSSMLEIQLTNDASNYNYEIIDVLGVKKQMQKPAFNGSQAQLRIESLSSGVYWLKVYNLTQITTIPFIKI
jgi:Secretion system C-terminal sorting domain